MAPTILWDASGLTKRYISEIGSEAVDAVFSAVPLPNMVITVWGYLETYAILRRRYNAKAFDYKAWADAATTLQREVIDSSLELLSIGDSTIFTAASLIDRHNMNSADAAILQAYLEFQTRLPGGSPPCLLVASDKRLLRAAMAEGLQVLDPENILPIDVPLFLSSL